jgi:hypothetical protein
MGHESCFPFAAIGHIFTFELSHEGELHYVRDFFVYTVDLTPIYITDIAADRPFCRDSQQSLT